MLAAHRLQPAPALARCLSCTLPRHRAALRLPSHNQQQLWPPLQHSLLPARQLVLCRAAALAEQPLRQQRLEQQWWERLQAVAAFQRRHAFLPRYKASAARPSLEGEEQLGIWCYTQRRRHKGQGTCLPLTNEQQAALEQLPGWSWDPYADAWQQQWQAVAAFQRQHGRLPQARASREVPVLVEGERLQGEWCQVQRQRKAGSRAPLLSPEQQDQLERLPGWQWEARLPTWEEWCKQVTAFIASYGRVPRVKGSSKSPLVEGEQRLGVWCKNQRRRWKGYGTPLPPQQQAQLEAVHGWWWEKLRRRDGSKGLERWWQRYEELGAFCVAHGRLPRTSAGRSEPFVEGEFCLGQWVQQQRQWRKGSGSTYQHTPEQRAALEHLPGWSWDPAADTWWRQHARLLAFQRKHGRLPSMGKAASAVHGEPEQAKWCTMQRQRKRGTTRPALSADQEKALEAVPGWEWDPRGPDEGE